MVKAWHPNVSVDQIYALMNLLRRLIDIALFVTMPSLFVNEFLATAILVLISSLLGSVAYIVFHKGGGPYLLNFFLGGEAAVVWGRVSCWGCA